MKSYASPETSYSIHSLSYFLLGLILSGA